MPFHRRALPSAAAGATRHAAPRSAPRPVARAVALALTGGIALGTANAQAPAPAAVQRVEVVGSNIKRLNAETALPVTVVTRQDIDRSGASTVQELIQTLGVTGQQGFETQASSSFVTGGAAVGLRGLTTNDTLVLLNGRRIAPFSSGQQGADGAVAFVDLNSLPLGAVEQIQILKDGASAIYGADAIAGVMNIVTRRDYQGLEFALRLGGYGEDGGRESKFSVIGGLGNLAQDGWSLLASAELARTEAIFFRERSFFRTFDHRGKAPWMGDRRSAFSDYGNYSVDGGAFRNGSNCPAANQRAGACRYDFGPVEQLQPEVERSGLLVVGRAMLGGSLTAFGELALNRNVVEDQSRAPAMDTATDFFQVDAARNLPLGRTRDLLTAALNNQVPAGLLTVPKGSTLDVRTRFTDNGPRSTRNENDARRIVVGLSGALAGLDWEAAYTDSSSQRTTLSRNEIAKDRLADLVVAGTANVFGITKTGYDSARFQAFKDSEATLRIVDAKLSGEIAQLPAGPLLMALGAERRDESVESLADPISRRGLLLGSANTDTNGERDLNSAYIEFSVPLAKGTELQLAARQDRYSDFGRSTNPKVALRWQPLASMLLRASWGTAFKAPTLFQLYEAQSAGGYLELQDTLRCPITNAVDDCDGRLIEVRSGGAQTVGIQLQPEESKNSNLGFVFEPVAGTSVSVDYWRIRKTNAITQNQPQAAIDTRSSAVLRNPTVGGVPGTIVRVITSYFNAFNQELAGVDVELNQRFPAIAGHRFSLSASFSYLTRFDETRDLAVGPANILGSFDGNAPTPRVKGVSSLRWDVGAWRSTLTANYLHGYRYTTANDPGVTVPLTRAPSHTTLDAQVAWSGLSNTTLRLGVRNLLDRDAPLLSFTAAGTNTSVYDARGRFVYVSANYRFK